LEEETRGITPATEHHSDAGVIEANHQPGGARRVLRSYQKEENAILG
jgi:hypothetical protein